MTRRLFSVERLDGSESCELCGRPALFQIILPLLGARNKLCGECAAVYVLQYLKNEGVAIKEICNALPQLSEFVDVPLSGLPVQ